MVGGLVQKVFWVLEWWLMKNDIVVDRNICSAKLTSYASHCRWYGNPSGSGSQHSFLVIVWWGQLVVAYRPSFRW
jgi:hypothetical protein